MPRLGERDPAKEQRWRQIIADWRSSGLSGAEYCRQHDIVYTQFNDWNKRFRKDDAERAAKTESFKKRRAKAVARGVRERMQQQAVEFAEVQLVEPASPARTAPAAVSSPLEVVLPTGIVLRMSPGCSLELLSAVVSVLEDR